MDLSYILAIHLVLKHAVYRTNQWHSWSALAFRTVPLETCGISVILQYYIASLAMQQNVNYIVLWGHMAEEKHPWLLPVAVCKEY